MEAGSLLKAGRAEHPWMPLALTFVGGSRLRTKPPCSPGLCGAGRDEAGGDARGDEPDSTYPFLCRLPKAPGPFGVRSLSHRLNLSRSQRSLWQVEGRSSGRCCKVDTKPLCPCEKEGEQGKEKKKKLKMICVSVALGYVSLPVLMLMSHLVRCMCPFVLFCFDLVFLLNKREKCVYFWQFKVM